MNKPIAIRSLQSLISAYIAGTLDASRLARAFRSIAVEAIEGYHEVVDLEMDEMLALVALSAELAEMKGFISEYKGHPKLNDSIFGAAILEFEESLDNFESAQQLLRCVAFSSFKAHVYFRLIAQQETPHTSLR